MAEKTTMLIRSVSNDIWERIDRLCRRRGWKRRDFLEEALKLFEAAEGNGNECQKAENAYADLERVSQITNILSAFEGAQKLKKRIEKIRKNINLMGTEEAQMNIILTLNDIESNLNEIIDKNLPKRVIPDDPKKRREMGLPEQFCQEFYDIPTDFDRELDKVPERERTESNFDGVMDQKIDELRKKFEQLMKKSGK